MQFSQFYIKVYWESQSGAQLECKASKFKKIAAIPTIFTLTTQFMDLNGGKLFISHQIFWSITSVSTSQTIFLM